MLSKMIGTWPATVSASALPLVRAILPPLWATAPVNVLFPASSSTPAPSFVSVPAEVPMTLLTVVLPAPPIVRFCAPLMPPDKVSVSASELMRVAAPSVMAPP